MNTIAEALQIEQRLRDTRADLLGPHLFEREFATRRRGHRRRAIRARVGRAFVAMGTWLQGTPAVIPASAQS